MSQQHGESARRALPPTSTDDSALSGPLKPQRAADAPPRRFHSALLRTSFGTLVPGTGLMGSRANALGIVLFILTVAAGAGVALAAFIRPKFYLSLMVNPEAMGVVSIGLGVLAGLWIVLVLGTYLVTRPRRLNPWQRGIGAITVALMSMLGSVPLAVAASYSHDSASLVNGVFSDTANKKSQTRATLNPVDPWANKSRLNILLLGGDNGAGRDADLGIRTDTIMMASIDTHTGATVIVQVPRNMARTPFPAGSALAKAYPHGFYNGYDPDNADYFANAIWDNVPSEHPELFKDTDYPGADALKLGIGTALGQPIDYFLLVNIDGIGQLVDAMGGATVNVNFNIARGGHTDGAGDEKCGVDGYLAPGPNRHLDGTDAMWYARSRRNDPQGDYGRMHRQSCLVNAIIRQANPQTMLTRFEGIAGATGKMVLTDIPQQSLDPIVQLAWKVKDAQVRRVVFVHHEDGYNTTNPDFKQMAARVQSAIVAADQHTALMQPSGAATNSQPGIANTVGQPSAAGQPNTVGQPATNPAVNQPSSAPSHQQASASAQQSSENVADACTYHPA